MSSCIVLIEDLKTGAPDVSAFGGTWAGGGAGSDEGGFNFMSGAGWGPCAGGLGVGGVGNELTPSFTGRLGGIDPSTGLFADKAGETGLLDTLICGLIGLAVEGLGASEGFVGSAICEKRLVPSD